MAARAEIPPGTVFGRDFEVVDFLAAGGMGTVYVARQISTGKKRALKVMHGRYEGDDRTRRRFAQEARAGAAIESDHLVEVLGAGIDDESGLPWIAMELLNGQDLKDVAEQRGALSRAEVLEIFRQMCHALAEAHREGVVHRDLKPENIFLANARREGVPFTVKVLDFGIAKLMAEATAVSSQTQAVGSPRWMAPEQADRGGVICPATDVWALGLIAFRLLTGKFYWLTANSPSPSVMAQMCEILMDPLEPASARAAKLGCGDKIPEGFDGWFSRAVARDIQSRFPNAAEAMAALAPLLSDGTDTYAHRRSMLPQPGASVTQGIPRSPSVPPMGATPPPGTLTRPVHTLGDPTPNPTAASQPNLDVLSERLPDFASAREAPPPRSGSSAYAIVGAAALVVLVGVGVVVGTRHHAVAPEPTVAHPPATVPDAAPSATPPIAPAGTPGAVPPVPVPPGGPAAGGTPAADAAVAALPVDPQLAAVAPVVDPHAGTSGHPGAHGAHAGVPGTAHDVDAAVSPAAAAPAHEGEGLLDHVRIQAILNEHTGEMEACFEHGTEGHPGAAGRLELTITLGEGPHPLGVGVSGLESTPAVGQCVQSLVRGLSFPATVGGTAVFNTRLRFSRGDAPAEPAPAPAAAPSPAPTPPPAAEGASGT